MLNNNLNDLTPIEMLMYNLIFSDDAEVEVSIMEYVDSVNEIEEFTDEILNNLILAGMKIKEHIFILTKDKKMWIIKFDR